MGLDVYLYHSSNFEKSTEAERVFFELQGSVWKNVIGNRESVSDADYREYRRALLSETEKLGLTVVRDTTGEGAPVDQGASVDQDSFTVDAGLTEYREDSKIHPGHLFKIGYFRSSYNEAGFNTVMRSLGFPDLYDIFDIADTDDGITYRVIDWESARNNVNTVIEKMNTLGDSGLWFMDLSKIIDFNKKMTAAEALDITAKELVKKHAFGSYGNTNGEFYLSGVQMISVINRRWLVYKMENNEGGLAWYRQAAEIVKETIDFVLDRPDPENWRLYWSA